jgi:hypothetical protein
MESPALVAALAAAAGAAAMLLLVTVVLYATRQRRSRADLEAMLAAAQREVDDLRHRLDELTGRVPVTPRRQAGGPAYLEELFGGPSVPQQRDTGGHEAPDPAWVITHVGEGAVDEGAVDDGVRVPDRLVLSATLGEPLVKVAAFSHGVRRALSAEARNRIWFEMKRETRASRRRRRQLRKRLERDYRAHLRAAETDVMENLA